MSCKDTIGTNEQVSGLKAISRLIRCIVCYQLTSSKCPGFSHSHSHAGIWRKRDKLYRFFFFKRENTFNNQNVSALWIMRVTFFPFEMLNYFKLSCWKPLIIQATFSLGKNSICWVVQKHRISLTFKVYFTTFTVPVQSKRELRLRKGRDCIFLFPEQVGEQHRRCRAQRQGHNNPSLGP